MLGPLCTGLSVELLQVNISVLLKDELVLGLGCQAGES